MSNVFLAFVYALSGNVLIYSSLAFINKQFMPGVFGQIYEHTNDFWRLVIVSALTISTANLLFSKIYRVTDPGNALTVILVSLILVLVGKSMLLGMGVMTWRTVLSVAVLACAAAWVSYELHRVA